VLQHKLDFEKVLATQARSRSTHFAVHHVGQAPTRPVPPAQRRLQAAQALSQASAPGQLSTSDAPVVGAPVDNLPAPAAVVAPTSAPTAAPEAVPQGHWLGTVVPKRHAKRSVTRSLLKRQMRAALARHAGQLPPGLWLLRLKAPFVKQDFPSAASDALRAAALAELDLLFKRAMR
jgi:ribonuclease P protein component